MKVTKWCIIAIAGVCSHGATAQVDYFEDFNGAGRPNAPGSLNWYYNDDMLPNNGWNDFCPGDGYAHITFDADTSNDTDDTSPFQDILVEQVGPGHRLEMRAKGAAVSGVGGFIFTYFENTPYGDPDKGIDEIDIEIVPDDKNTGGGYDHQDRLLPPDGWTDARFNTWANSDYPSYDPSLSIKTAITDAAGNKVSHIDDAFHIYTIEWEHDPNGPVGDGRDGHIEFYIDGVLQAVIDHPVPEDPASVIVGVRQMSWTGTLDFEGTKTMLIDWVDISPIDANSPNALADSYAVVKGENLVIDAAGGILANDSGSGLSCVLIDDVENGTLTLGGDGSFTYVPNAGFVGKDTFTYRASNGGATGDSNGSIVTIEVFESISKELLVNPTLSDAQYILNTGVDPDWRTVITSTKDQLTLNVYNGLGTPGTQHDFDLVAKSGAELAAELGLDPADIELSDVWLNAGSWEYAWNSWSAAGKFGDGVNTGSFWANYLIEIETAAGIYRYQTAALVDGQISLADHLLELHNNEGWVFDSGYLGSINGANVLLSDVLDIRFSAYADVVDTPSNTSKSYYIIKSVNVPVTLTYVGETGGGTGGVPGVLLEDDFEDGNFVARAQSTVDNAPWVRSNTRLVDLVSGNGSAEAVRMRKSNTLSVAFSTAGYEQIELSYDRSLLADLSKNGSIGVVLEVQWSLDGVSWNTLLTESQLVTGTLPWDNQVVLLPVAAVNQNEIHIQFKTTSTKNADKALLDNIIVSGVTIN
jgi:hypothetical protein